VRQGYTILECSSGNEALDYCAKYHGPIDLVLTDVVMPGLTGGELGRKLQRLYPQIKILYMTGYTEDTVVHHGVVNAGVRLLQKPFTPQILTRKVREVLDTHQPFSVLVVDDEADVRSAVCAMLEHGGYQVCEASNGKEAMAQFEGRPIDLLLTDLVMSEKEGIEPTQNLRIQFPNLKIVIMSGASRSKIAEVAAKLEAQATLQKPIQPEELLETVRKVLGRS
jgi:CheY-like chemotaxis protein